MIMEYQVRLDTCLKAKKRLLEDFGINFTEEVSNEISTLFPNEVSIDRYTRKLILEKLGD